MLTKQNKQYFLATTANEEFWDTSKPIVFLGDWCLRYHRKAFWESFSREVLQSPWNNEEKFESAFRYVNDTYEALLPLLALKLNVIHNENLSQRAWRIIVGPWLLHYIHILYDRYASIRIALDAFPEITTIGLSREAFIVPKDTLEFVHLSAEDFYNLQLFTEILTHLGIEFPKKSAEADLNFLKTGASKYRANFKKKLLDNLFKFSQKCFLNYSPIVLSNPFFTSEVILKIFLKTKGKVCNFNTPGINFSPSPIDLKTRGILACLTEPRNEFESILIKMMPLVIPQIYIERYQTIKDQVKRKYPKKTKVIFSSVAWFFDEGFKFWAGFLREDGVRLIGAQHGGNYGSSKYVAAEDYELSITDKYYSWGWQKDTRHSKVIPGYANKLVGRPVTGYNNQLTDILLVTIDLPRYLHRFDPIYYKYNEYFGAQHRFVKSLEEEFRAKLRIRLFGAEDYGQDISERWKNSFPGIILENYDVRFNDRLRKSRICVSDCISTTFLESLASNIPTILFWDSKIFPLRNEAMPFYEKLRSVNILFNTPEEAAGFVQKIYFDIERWWMNPKLQQITKIFCNQFVRFSSDATNYWAKEFNKMTD